MNTRRLPVARALETTIWRLWRRPLRHRQPHEQAGTCPRSPRERQAGPTTRRPNSGFVLAQPSARRDRIIITASQTAPERKAPAFTRERRRHPSEHAGAELETNRGGPAGNCGKPANSSGRIRELDGLPRAQRLCAGASPHRSEASRAATGTSPELGHHLPVLGTPPRGLGEPWHWHKTRMSSTWTGSWCSLLDSLKRAASP